MSKQKKRGGCCSFVVGGMVVVAILIALMIFGAQNVPRPTQNSVSNSESETSTASSSANVIPGLAPVDLYLNLTDKGFELSKDFENPDYPIWTCTERTTSYQAQAIVYGAGSSRVEMIRASIDDFTKRQENKQEAKDFLSFIATMPYDGSEPAKARDWVRKNIGRNTSTVIGGVKFELHAKARGNRTLMIEPAHGDE